VLLLLELLAALEDRCIEGEIAASGQEWPGSPALSRRSARWLVPPCCLPRATHGRPHLTDVRSGRDLAATHERDLEVVRAHLHEPAVGAAWSDGHNMTLDQATRERTPVGLQLAAAGVPAREELALGRFNTRSRTRPSTTATPSPRYTIAVRASGSQVNGARSLCMSSK
jgi:hypothetical protein